MHFLRGRSGRGALACLALLIAGSVMLAHGVDHHPGAETHLMVNPTALDSAGAPAPGGLDGSGLGGTFSVGLCVALLGSLLGALATRALTPASTVRFAEALAQTRAGPGTQGAPARSTALRLSVRRC